MSPDEIRTKSVFTKGFFPLPHPNHAEGLGPDVADQVRGSVGVAGRGVGDQQGGKVPRDLDRGVRITIRNADTGELLADGVTAGGSGDTDRIMKVARRRLEPLSTEDAATSRTTLDLAMPQ
jgi:hypothetical protein